jgi:DMSO/TMAO reductase YedYZ molybdopterin-dependent catalytic subunit
MKKRLFSLLVFLTLFFVAGCQPAQNVQPTVVQQPTLMQSAATQPAADAKPAAAEPSPTTAASAQAEAVLTLTNLEGKSKDFTLDDLKKLPASEGQAGIKSSTGKITPPDLFKGVLLTNLLAEVGGANSSMGIQIEAKDGYAMTFSADQLINGDFIAYDPATGDETQSAGKLQVLIAYEMDGKPLDTERDGILRLVIISEKNNQVTDGHWSIKWIRKIDLKQLAQEWTLSLDGGIKDTLDRGSFESCSTNKCHQSTWIDGKAQTWSGTPLWLLIGRMDDEIKHGDNSFNKDLAAKGYTVEVVGKDGYSVTFDIARLIGNKNIILANQVNENPLTDADFPLRLVGSDVQKKEGVGGIEKIILHLNVQPTTAPTATPASAPASTGPATLPEGKALLVNGLVEKEQAWSLDELKKLEVVKLTVEHPKKGNMEVEGVRLSALLDLVKAKADAKTVTFTASDGFTSTADTKDILACKDCMVSFNESGGLNLAMPGLASSLWVKNVIVITLQ